MFPMLFDHRALESLPVPEPGDIDRVVLILKTLCLQRILPYFRQKRGSDSGLTGRLGEHLKIVRLEDEGNDIPLVGFLFRDKELWTVELHEKIFDYLAFVFPSDPRSRLGGGLR